MHKRVGEREREGERGSERERGGGGKDREREREGEMRREGESERGEGEKQMVRLGTPLLLLFNCAAITHAHVCAYKRINLINQ